MRGRPFERGHNKGFKKGESGNPGGRPKAEVSLTHWLREFGGMTTAEAAKACKLYAAQLRKADSGDLPIAAIAALRVWISQINEPQPGIFGHLLERLDGKVEQKLGGELNLRVPALEAALLKIYGSDVSDD